jgi:hypothetical protein
MSAADKVRGGIEPAIGSLPIVAFLRQQVVAAHRRRMSRRTDTVVS